MPKPISLDTRLLDYIEARAKPGMKWVARESRTGRGFRLHQTRGETWDDSHNFPTAREALLAEMEKFPMIWYSKTNHPELRFRRCCVEKYRDQRMVVAFPDGLRVDALRSWIRRA